MQVAALVLAAGRGERLGRDIPKAFVPVAGVPMLVRALDRLCAVPEVDLVVPVIPAEAFDRYAGLGLGEYAKLAPAVAGGAERQDSVRAGLQALPSEIQIVAVHDAARCLVEPADVARAISAAREFGAALLARRATDTVKRVQQGFVRETPPREECWLAQTPQVFRSELLREALDKAEAEGFLGTDDAQLVERLGVAARIVEGGARNLKITCSEDLMIAEQWLAAGEGRAE